MKLKLSFSLILFAALIVIQGCVNSSSSDSVRENENEIDQGNFNEEGMPIVNETITLDFFAGQSPQSNNDDWNNIMIWEHYAEMTNIDVDFNAVPFDSILEKRNLLLTGGNLPDAFYNAHLSNLDLLKYAEQGTFIPLNNLIEEHAPNFSALLDKYPEIKKAIIFPDGNIYSIPYLHDPKFLGLRIGAMPWINEDFLDKLGMDMPETTEAFYQYLKKVKDEDDDAIPYGGDSIDSLVGWMKGAFGLGYNGPHLYDLPPDEDDLRFIPTTDNYKEMLMYINKLFEEELIEQNIFSIEHDQYISNAAEGLYGSTVFFDPDEVFGGEALGSFEGGLPLKGPDGDQIYGDINHPAFSLGSFAITNENQYPKETIRWIDHFFSEEGTILFFMGIEDETYHENPDGTFEYTDEITNSPEGLTLDQEISKYLTWVGSLSPSMIKEKTYFGSESTEAAVKAANKIEPFLTDDIWPQFTYTEEESKVMSNVGSDIEKYVAEMRDKFIAGQESFSEWDFYVETLQEMGLEEYMEIQRAALERYKSN